MEDSSSDFQPAQLLAQVHDSLLCQYLSTDFAAMARFCIALGRDYMRPILDYGEPYRLNTDLKVGFDWANLSEIGGFMALSEEALVEKLREVWETKRPSKKLVA